MIALVSEWDGGKSLAAKALPTTGAAVSGAPAEQEDHAKETEPATIREDLCSGGWCGMGALAAVKISKGRLH